MARKQRISDLGYRLRRRIVTALRSRNSQHKWLAKKALNQQADQLRQLQVYAQFLAGDSIDTITSRQHAWTREQVEEAIRTRGGTA